MRTEFFECLDFAMQFMPALPEEDRSIREQLARIGVGPGKTFDFGSLSLEDKAEILLGRKRAQTKVAEAAKNLGKDINGRSVGAAFGDAAFLHGDWLLRAGRPDLCRDAPLLVEGDTAVLPPGEGSWKPPAIKRAS